MCISYSYAIIKKICIKTRALAVLLCLPMLRKEEYNKTNYE